MKKSFAKVFYFVLIAIVLWAIVAAIQSTEAKYAISEPEYKAALENGQVEKISINQNKEVPTGNIIIKFKNSTEKRLYVTDVTVAEKYVKDNYPKFVLSLDDFDFSRDGIIHKNIIKWLLEE